MAGAYVRLTVTDSNIAEVMRRIAHPEVALAEIGEVLVQSTQARFGSQTDPEGNRWAANSEVTLERYLGRRKSSYTKTGRISAAGRRRLATKLILTDSGILGDTIHWQMDGRTTLLVGTSLIYGAAMQFGMPQGYAGRTRRGAPIPWGDIPPRPYLGLSAEDEQAIQRILVDYLTP